MTSHLNKTILLILFLGQFSFAPLCSLPNTKIAKEQALQGPEWVREGVIYSIFLRNFSPTGDFPGATLRLKELKKLGVNILWILPIHPNGQLKKKGTFGSPYAIKDYYAIDPSYGTKGDFKIFVEKAHQLGMKVIIDAVLNHTSWDNVLMKDPNFYRRDQNGKIRSPLPEWNDVAALDYSNPKVRTYMLDMLGYWLKEFDLDGFRCDAAAMIPIDFWKEARTKLHQIKASILLLDEAEEPEALVKAFDLDYAWKFGRAIDDVLINGAPATKTLHTVLEVEKESNPRGALHMRFSDNHDTKRAITRFGEKGALAASALVFTMNGVPLIYNGMEVGDTGETHDPGMFEKTPIFWKVSEIRPEFIHFYKEMIELRKKYYRTFAVGELIWLRNSDDNSILTYLRKGGGKEFLVAINCSSRPFSGSVEIEVPKLAEEVMFDLGADLKKTRPYAPLPNLSLLPWEFRIFRLK